MTSTKAEPGPFDGMERAAPDEPVFTLRAKDVLAPDLIHTWVRQRREAIARADLHEEKRTLELIQAREAEALAWAMVDWRNGQNEVPPVEVAQPQRYSGSTMDADELAAKARFDRTKGACRQLNNSVAECTEAVEALELSPADRLALTAAVEEIKSLAYLYEPKRAAYAHRS